MTQSKKSLKEQQAPTNFCTRPWTELHIEEDGKTTPCCVMPSNRYPMGDTIKEYLTGQPLKELKTAFLKNEKHPNCTYCWENEKYNLPTHRVLYPTYRKDSKNIEKIHIRLNNVCNFKCRMCNPSFSTTWAIENNKHKYFSGHVDEEKSKNIFEKDPQLLELFKGLIQNGSLKQINISGGEPLITDANAQLLTFLIDNNCTDISLSYSTNLSNLYYKKYNLRDLWKHFRDVNLLASCDGWGPQNEYGRSGFDTKVFLTNLKAAFPFVTQICCVVNKYSVWTIPDLLKIMDKLGKRVTLNPCYDPPFTNAQSLPQELKEEIKALYKHDRRLIKLYNDFISQSKPDNMKHFIDYNLLLDQYRGTSFFNTFPQFKNYEYMSLGPSSLHKNVVYPNKK